MAQCQLGAPRSAGETFFWSSPIFGRNMLRNLESAKSPTQCKSGPGNNMTEQIIEFELTGTGPPGRTCTPTNGYIYEKAKISLGNLRVDYYFQLKYCTRQCTMLSPTWAKPLTNFNNRLRDFECGSDLNCK